MVGGWRAQGGTVSNHQSKPDKTSVGYDYVHSLVDDHSRLAYSEVLPDEKGTTCAAFFTRATAYFAAHGITQEFIQPHCPWQDGKVERLNRTLATEWAYRQPFTSNQHHLPPGSSTTTLNANTQHSEDNHRSADCHQPDGRVHLGRCGWKVCWLVLLGEWSP